MFFYIDESGNSGNNLFDKSQPVLSYGILSSKTNVDLMGIQLHRAILSKIGADSIHASKLNFSGLLAIAGELGALQQRFDFHFDYYFVDKLSFASVMLFDAVFDAGMNEAVKWEWYWTPLRFPVVVALSQLADEDLLREAWDLRLTPTDKIEQRQNRIAAVLETLLRRLETQPMDKRLREIIGDGLRFGIENPSKLDFGTSNQKFMSPNAVCFQFVLRAIADRLKKAKRQALKITVDRQSEFNPAQLQTYTYQSNLSKALKGSPSDKEAYLSHPLHQGSRESLANLISHFPDEKMSVENSSASIGLQLVDVYLWLANRALRGESVPSELSAVASTFLKKSRIDGISIEGMTNRWKEFERLLPKHQDVSPELLDLSDRLVTEHREKVRLMNLKK